MSAPELAARMLQIAPDAWLATLAEFQHEVPPAPPGETVEDELRRCLGALARVFRRHDPHTAPAAVADGPTACPACGERQVAPLLTRRPSMRYGRCASCGHGVLLGDGAPADEAAVHALYAGPGYYRVRTADGVGYDAYDSEAAYREAKGARLVERLRAGMPAPRTLLEVGSGYGFTRVAAERAGIRTAGVDLNADAGAEAARRYDLATFCGTLAQALLSPASEIAAGAFDIALYQFVLEHVVDPARELGAVRAALRPGGTLAMLVPSMEAAEIGVFGGSYRSFRADHLHLFSRASLAALLEPAGFRVVACESGCNVHLFRDFLSPAALSHLYESGFGPDLFLLAERLP